MSVQWKAGYINVVGSNSNFWNSGDVTGGIGNGTVSKSEFSQEKKWIRSGNKWVLTGSSSTNDTRGSVTSSTAGTTTSNSMVGNRYDSNNESNSSLLAEMGGLLPTMHSTESCDVLQYNHPNNNNHEYFYLIFIFNCYYNTYSYCFH